MSEFIPISVIGSSTCSQEVAILAEKSDVSEELQRFDSHLEQLQGILRADEQAPVGRKLEFLAQELMRNPTS